MIGRTIMGLLKGIVAVVGVAGGLMGASTQAETVHAVTQFSYDENLRPLCTTVRMNSGAYGALPADACTLGAEGVYGPDRITRNTYNDSGRLIQVDQAYGTNLQRPYVRYTYTNNGLKATEKDANGNLTTLEYDGFDRLIKLRYPSTVLGAGTSSTTDYEAYDYDLNGNRTHWRRRDGQIIKDCFDKHNRVIVHYVHSQSGCSATGGTKDVYTTYDLTGKILNKRFASFAGSGVSYAYDGLGRVSSTMDMNNRSVGYAYNAASARISLIYPDLNTIGWGLDNANRLSTIGWNATSGLFTNTYDSLGRLVGEGKWGGTTTYGYNAIGRLASKTNDILGTGYDAAWTFTYNPAGQIQSSSATSTVFDYDQTVSVTENRTFDGLNRDAGIVSVGGYDARGNLTYEGAGGRTMTYDIENRLLTVTGTAINVKLDYDPEGRLYRYSADGGANWTTFLYDGVNLIGEYAGSATTPLHRYVHGSGTDNPLIWFNGPGINAGVWYYTNHQGSIVSTADGGGNPVHVYRYDPYGVPTDLSNTSAWWGSRFRYTGQTMLPEAKLYYYKARVYDPAYGRFLQTDPIGAEDDLNLYAYVAGDPVNGTDPSGTCIWDACAGEAALALVGAYAAHTTCVATKCYDAMAEGLIAGGRAVGDGFNAVGNFASSVAKNEAKKYERAWVSAERLISKSENEKGPTEHQYALRAAKDGIYPDKDQGGVVELKSGDVWKYGTTAKGDRYTQKDLANLNLNIEYQSSGTESQVLAQEKLQILDYVNKNKRRPPGNPIYR